MEQLPCRAAFRERTAGCECQHAARVLAPFDLGKRLGLTRHAYKSIQNAKSPLAYSSGQMLNRLFESAGRAKAGPQMSFGASVFRRPDA